MVANRVVVRRHGEQNPAYEPAHPHRAQPAETFGSGGLCRASLGTGPLTPIDRRRQMPRGDVETFWEDGQWHNKVEGEEGNESSHETKAEATEAGRDMALGRKVEHIVKNQDGTISERSSHGNDPRNVPG
jgi:uncharacterized protein DUF2188